MTATRSGREVLGTWRVASLYSEDWPAGKRRRPLGASPKGRLMILPNGYMMVFLTAPGRRRAKTDADRARAYKSIFAYSGRYKIDGERFVTDVDVASPAQWMGARQARTWRVAGRRLQFTTEWSPSAFDPRRRTRGVIEFERETTPRRSNGSGARRRSGRRARAGGSPKT